MRPTSTHTFVWSKTLLPLIGRHGNAMCVRPPSARPARIALSVSSLKLSIRFGASFMLDATSIPANVFIHTSSTFSSRSQDKKIIWYCSQLDEDGLRLFRPKKGYLLLKIKKKGYRTPTISYMYPGHDEEFWVPQYVTPSYNSFPHLAAAYPHAAAQLRAASLPPGVAVPPGANTLLAGNPPTLVVASRSPYDPPALKKRKVGEGSIGEDDAAAVLSDLGRSSSPPGSPRSSSPKIRVLDDDNDDQDISDDEDTPSRYGRSAAGRNSAGSASSPNGAATADNEDPQRTRRNLRGGITRRSTEAANQLLRSHANATNKSSPSPSSSSSARAQPLPGSFSSPASSASAGLTALAGTPPPHSFFSQHPSASPFPYSQASAAAEMYKLYSGLNHPALASAGLNGASRPSASATSPATPSPSSSAMPATGAFPSPPPNPIDPTAPLDPGLFQQQQQQLQILQQQLYNAHLAQTGNPTQAQAYLLHHQQRLAQLALQQAQHLQLQQQMLLQQQQQLQQQQLQPQRTSQTNGPSIPSCTTSSSPSSATSTSAAASTTSNIPKIILTANALKASSSSVPKATTNDMDVDASTDSSLDSGDEEGDSEHSGSSSRRDDSGLSKRNKFFYKQLRDHLEDDVTLTPIGFVNDWYYLMDPKLHVGPNNRGGTFEKRVKLHFIEYLEVVHNGTTLWLCWGTLLDAAKAPIFRRSSHFYRIPGSQSTILKSPSRATQDWDVASDDSKQQMRKWATLIKNALDAKWDYANIDSARSLVDVLNLPLPSSPPLDEKGEPIVKSSRRPSTVSLTTQKLDAEGFLKSTDSKSSALYVWRNCGLPVPEENPSVDSSWTDEAHQIDAQLEKKLANTFGMSDRLDVFRQLFSLLVAPTGTLTFSKLELAFQRFGCPMYMMAKMLDLVSTGAFNADMTAASARAFLADQPEESYLIRLSHNQPGVFVLCYRVDGVDQATRVFNQPAAGLAVETDSKLEKASQWSSIIKGCPAIRTPQISSQYSSFKDHKLAIADLLTDKRFLLPSDSDSSNLMDVDEAVNTREVASSSSAVPAQSNDDAAALAKLSHERSSDVLSYLAKLRGLSKITTSDFQEWCLYISSAQGKEVTNQLHSLLTAFREEPDLWVNFAREVIPRKATV